MNFKELINKIMPLVSNVSNEPIVLWRDKNGEWNIEQVKSLNEMKRQDPYAISFVGSDLAGEEPAFVFYKVLTSRLNSELENIPKTASNYDALNALVSFIESNIASFSFQTLDYFMLYDEPLTAFQNILKTNNLSYEEANSSEVIEIIEEKINDLINRPKDEVIPSKPKISVEGYEEINSIQLSGETIFIGENPNAIGTYLVCNIRVIGFLGLEERYNGQTTNNFMESLREFINRVDKLLTTIEKERLENNLPQQVLTLNDCIEENNKTDWNDMLLIIKPEVLAPEYRSAEHQLVLCTGGFGAVKNARGQSVFVKELFSGMEARYNRSQIAGIADCSKLPNWAIEKLELLKMINFKELQNDAQKKKTTLQEKLENAKGITKTADKTENIKDKHNKKHR